MDLGTVYRTKYDWWLTAIILGSFAACVVAGAQLLGEPGAGPWIGLALFAAGLFVLWILVKTEYEIADRELILRSGPFRWRIGLAAIQKVTPSHNPLSAPACSLDRLRIDFLTARGKPCFALVSPKDKKGFLRDLAAAAPGLVVEGDSAFRGGSADAPVT